MKKRLIKMLLASMLIVLCVGCGDESTTAEQANTSSTALEEECTSEPVEIVEKETLSNEESSELVSEINIASGKDTKNETELAETTPEEATEPEKIVDSEQPETQTVDSIPQYTFTDISLIMYAQQTVNIRDLPDTNGKKLGSLSTNDEISITGQCNETSWYRFEYNGNVAFVSNKYVGENKVEIQQAPADNSTADTGSAASNWADSYPKNEWIDMGSYFFYIANSQPEANQVCCDCSQERFYGEYLWQQELWSRYPDRNVSYFSNNANGIPIAVVCSNYEDETNFYRPKFVWETTKLSARVIYVD